MQFLNKQGQQASSKILEHPDEVITRWRSYTIWRYGSAEPDPDSTQKFHGFTTLL
jgi:hypothetical protein